MFVIAQQIDLNKLGTKRIWIPPNGRPYWVLAGQSSVGPELTDKRLRRYGLIQCLKYPFNKIWAEGNRIRRIKNSKAKKRLK